LARFNVIAFRVRRERGCVNDKHEFPFLPQTRQRA